MRLSKFLVKRYQYVKEAVSIDNKAINDYNKNENSLGGNYAIKKF